MGYTTEFIGRFELDHELDGDLYNDLIKFSETRHGGDLNPYPGFPGFWCDWVPSEDKKYIKWNRSEKFYGYVEWLVYLIENFLKPKGYVLNGEVDWRGEDFYDTGTICVNNNVVSTRIRQA